MVTHTLQHKNRGKLAVTVETIADQLHCVQVRLGVQLQVQVQLQERPWHERYIAQHCGSTSHIRPALPSTAD